MRLVVSALFAIAACFVVQTSFSSRAAAQVVISGQVTSYSTTSAPPAPAAPSGYVATGGAPAPTRYVHRSASIPALWVPGLIALLGGFAVNLFGIGWLVAPAGTSVDWYGYGIIPVIGPWLQWAAPEGNRFPEWSIATGIIEDVGLVLLILGLVLREEWDEPVYTFNESDPRSATLAFGLSGVPSLPGSTTPATGGMATLTLSHF